jgi:uncharacterized membrane protein YebE (DUF533 family)
MFDATKLLGELVANTSTPSAGGRLNAALSQGAGAGSLGSLFGGGGAGGGGGLGDLLGQLVGGAQRAAGTARTEVESNNPVAVGGLGALAGAILGGGKGAVGGGLMAVLGSLAVSALQNAAQSAAAAKTTAPAPTAAPVLPAALPATQEDAQATAHLILRAMISAAKADGQIDSQEMNKIIGKLSEAGSDPAGQQFVVQEMSKPSDIQGLAADAKTPELAVQVYAASLFAIEVDSPAEQFYLSSLAQALHLTPETVAKIHSALGLA